MIDCGTPRKNIYRPSRDLEDHLWRAAAISFGAPSADQSSLTILLAFPNDSLHAVTFPMDCEALEEMLHVVA